MSLAELKRARRRGAPLVGFIPSSLLDRILCDAEPTTRSKCKCGSQPRPNAKHCSKKCAIAAATARLCGTSRSAVLQQVVQQPQFPLSCRHCGRPAKTRSLYCSDTCALATVSQKRYPLFVTLQGKHMPINTQGSVTSTTGLEWKHLHQPTRPPSGPPPPYSSPMLTKVELQQISRPFRPLDAEMGYPTSPLSTGASESECSSYMSSIAISDDESVFEIAPLQPTRSTVTWHR